MLERYIPALINMLRSEENYKTAWESLTDLLDFGTFHTSLATWYILTKFNV